MDKANAKTRLLIALATASLLLVTLAIACAAPAPTTPAATTQPGVQYETLELSLAAQYTPGYAGDSHLIFCETVDKLLRENTGGKVTVKHSGEGQVYSSLAEAVKATMLGALDFVYPAQSRAVTGGLQSWNIFSVPGLLTPGAAGEGKQKYGERLYKFFNDPEAVQLFSAEAQNKGVKVFPQSISVTMPLQLVAKGAWGPAELKGKKFGMPGGSGYRLFAQNYGVTAIPLVAMGERYGALQQNMIDGIIGTHKGLCVTYRWVELAPYVMTEPLLSSVQTLLFNSNKWNSLSPALQKLLEEKVIPEATRVARASYIKEWDLMSAEHAKLGGKDYTWSKKEVEELYALYPKLAETYKAEGGGKLVDIALKYQ